MASTNDICNKATGPPNWLRDSQCRNFAQSYDITRSSASMGCSGPKWNQLGDGSLQHPVDAGTGSRSSNSGEPVTITDQQLSARDAWQNAQLKVDIVTHPRYEQLLAAHVDCLQVATPVDHLPSIEAQLANAQQVAARYSVSGRHTPPAGDEKEELDHFMGSYIVLLQSFKDQLHEHMRVHAMDAILDCWQLEQAFTKLTGLPLGEGSGATMSEDDNECIEENELHYVDNEIYDGFGPLIPSETERSLMERVRQELKLEFKQEYRSRISDVREEILRKRRAGKLPGETTSLLKRWWSSHSKWPYPTEEEKARLVQETGLELKQINNWFINQRKRNWHNNNNNNSFHNNNIQSISPSILTQK